MQALLDAVRAGPPALAVPPPRVALPLVPDYPPGAAAHAPLVGRLDWYYYQAARLRREARTYAVLVRYAARWAAARPALAVVPPSAAEWLTARNDQLAPDQQVTQSLLLARAAGVEDTEAVALVAARAAARAPYYPTWLSRASRVSR